jgi:hypothetical protein
MVISHLETNEIGYTNYRRPYKEATISVRRTLGGKTPTKHVIKDLFAQ